MVPTHDDVDRTRRWFLDLKHKSDIAPILLPQRIGCMLINLGPGPVSSARAAYVLKLFKQKPGQDPKPEEEFRGTFGWGPVVAPGWQLAETAVITTYYPYFAVQLEDKSVWNVRGEETSFTHLETTSVLRFEHDNSVDWGLLVAQQEAMKAAAHDTFPTAPPSIGSA